MLAIVFRRSINRRRTSLSLVSKKRVIRVTGSGNVIVETEQFVSNYSTPGNNIQLNEPSLQLPPSFKVSNRSLKLLQ